VKIVVAESIAKAGIEELQKESGWRVVLPEEYAADPAAALKDSDALIVRSAVKANANLIDQANAVRVIGRAGVGVDNVDVDAATKRGIVVMNTPGGTAVAVAELAMGMMFALARHLVRADVTTRAGQWEKKSLQGTELNNKTLGIIGVGRIGAEVAKRARALGMKVIASDPYLAPARAGELEIELGPIEKVFAAADYLSLHVGLTPQTTKMLNDAAFAQMKKGVRIVNCARGELIDEAALAKALESGQVAAAALDVFAQEPPKDSPLLRSANVLATPHIGASTREGQEAVGVQIARQVRDYLKFGVVQNAINLPSLTDVEYAQLRPYITLAEQLGSFLSQLFESNLQVIEVAFEGEIAEWKNDLVVSAAIGSVLRAGSDETINWINARHLAEERGIVARESRHKESPFGNAVHMRLIGSAGAFEARGILVRGNWPRIIEMNGIELEARSQGNFVVIQNADSPGVVGGVGTTLGKHGVNIARLSVGRKNGQALAIVEVDGDISPAVLSELKRIPAVQSVKQVKVL
jgi:D-3-phosphoglycerate dehydrogenase